MTIEPRPLLAAVSYRRGAGNMIDTLLGTIASRLVKAGHGVAGAIKHETQRPDRHRCDMVLENLHTGEFVPISQDLGAEARGCMLDSYALESVVGSTLAKLESGAEFLVINRFGKQEVDGRGFRPAVEFAACHQVPCLIGLEQENLMAWRAFAGVLGEELPCNEDLVWNWCLDALAA